MRRPARLLLAALVAWASAAAAQEVAVAKAKEQTPVADATSVPSPSVDPAVAERFAKLALGCVDQEYPNKIAHTLASDADVKPPRELTPAFFGCYDWHSAVHGHWLLVRLLRTVPGASWAPAARAALARHLTAERLQVEAAYLQAAGRASFERPYGLAWLLQLAAELRGWDDPDARRWSAALQTLETAAAERLSGWLPKLSHPVRSGEHSQTAFALGLALDWARGAGDREREQLFRDRARALFQKDRDCPLEYEPSGEDFLSPCLAEADLMRRVVGGGEYAKWLQAFLPGLPGDSASSRPAGVLWLEPLVSPDPSDPKLAHLDGLDLSRAWMLEGIAHGLPSDDPRLPVLRAAAAAHREVGLRAVTGEHYEGGHWLGSFATYLVTGRGLADDAPRAMQTAAPSAAP